MSKSIGSRVDRDASSRPHFLPARRPGRRGDAQRQAAVASESGSRPPSDPQRQRDSSDSYLRAKARNARSPCGSTRGLRHGLRHSPAKRTNAGQPLPDCNQFNARITERMIAVQSQCGRFFTGGAGATGTLPHRHIRAGSLATHTLQQQHPSFLRLLRTRYNNSTLPSFAARARLLERDMRPM
jgi:hypothetical protein